VEAVAASWRHGAAGRGAVAAQVVGESLLAKPSFDFIEIPLVREQLRAASRFVGDWEAEDFSGEIDSRMEQGGSEVRDLPLEFDSPLEVAFWLWWMACRKVDSFCHEDIVMRRHHEVLTADGARYVLDFVVTPTASMVERYPDRQWPLIGVELDGHTFHEKTLEQVTYRNQRDRALQQIGWRVFHFSFAEFTKNPRESIFEVVEHARFIYGRVIGYKAAAMGKYLPLAK
jgi:hypothetical protein